MAAALCQGESLKGMVKEWDGKQEGPRGDAGSGNNPGLRFTKGRREERLNDSGAFLRGESC